MEKWHEIEKSDQGSAMSLTESDVRRLKYTELLTTHVRSQFPDFVNNLQRQSPHDAEKGRVAIVEYCEGNYSSQKTFESSQELQSYFDTTAETKLATPKQRLFILEDLPRNYVEILGSQLRTPPSVFGSHWSDPTTPTFNHRSPFSRFSENRLMVAYAANQAVKVETPRPFTAIRYQFNSNVSRHLHLYDPQGPLIDQPKSYHIFSFWTTGARSDGSWDSILIVDPPLGRWVRSLDDGTHVGVDHYSKEYAFSRIHELEPEFEDIDILPEDQSNWITSWEDKPRYMSMFDDILCATHTDNPRINHPREVTEIARRLVISTFLTFLRRRTLNFLRLQADPGVAILHINRCDYLRDFAKGVLSNWHHALFGFVVNAKYRMELMAKETETNMAALGFTKDGRPLSQAKVDIPQWEIDGWHTILASCNQIIAMGDTFLQSYLQFSNMQEAKAANRNALNLSRITNLTMLFVPLSSIAAVFSMSDDFQPGKPRGWIYWAVVLPVLMVMFALTTESRSLLRQWWSIGKERVGRKRQEEPKDIP